MEKKESQWEQQRKLAKKNFFYANTDNLLCIDFHISPLPPLRLRRNVSIGEILWNNKNRSIIKSFALFVSRLFFCWQRSCRSIVARSIFFLHIKFKSQSQWRHIAVCPKMHSQSRIVSGHRIPIPCHYQSEKCLWWRNEQRETTTTTQIQSLTTSRSSTSSIKLDFIVDFSHFVWSCVTTLSRLPDSRVIFGGGKMNFTSLKIHIIAESQASTVSQESACFVEPLSRVEQSNALESVNESHQMGVKWAIKRVKKGKRFDKSVKTRLGSTRLSICDKWANVDARQLWRRWSLILHGRQPVS